MQKKLFHLYLKVNLYSKLYTMTQKTKILTLSLVSVAGLAAFTAFASNNISSLDFKGEVKQNINLELKQLNLMPDITQKNNGGAAGISWKIVWDTLTTVDPATNAPNTVTKQGKFSFGGHGNITNAAESLILAGEENNLSANTSIVGASKKIIGNQGEGNTVLSSSDITFAGDNHIINSSAHTQVNWTGNIVFSSEDVAINTIGSMAVGKKIRINHPGSFIFNGTDTEVASNKAYTTKIMADKGMIINTNSQKADGVDLTINGGLKVAHNTTDGVWAIISQEKCLKIKGVNKGEIWFWCSTTPETQISTPKCGKNAADYPATANAWKESSDRGFCENGTLSPSTRPTFWTDAEKAAAKSNGSYASAGFGKYSFTICFVEGDPFCKASGAKKTWRCTTQEGNAMTCEATIEGSKAPVTEPKKCKANEHLEGTTCVANTKQVACDNTNISSSANGTVSNNQVTITRSNGSWSAPEKCKLNCNTGYEKKTDPITHRESCEKKTEIENGFCKPKITRDTQICMATNSDEIKKKVNQNVDFYNDRESARLKNKVRPRWMYIAWSPSPDMPEYVRHWELKNDIFGGKIFIPAMKNHPSLRVRKWIVGAYYGQRAIQPSPIFSSQIDIDDLLYLKLDPHYFYSEAIEKKDPELKKLWDDMQDFQFRFSNEGFRELPDVYQQVAGSNPLSSSLDKFCYYDTSFKKCQSKVYSLKCDSPKNIAAKQCGGITDKNSCIKNSKCKWAQE